MSWDEREAVLLGLAESIVSNIEADVAVRGVRVDGKLNRALSELRQRQVALARALGHIDIPDSDSSRTLHGRQAAEVRWGQRSA